MLRRVSCPSAKQLQERWPCKADLGEDKPHREHRASSCHHPVPAHVIIPCHVAVGEVQPVLGNWRSSASPPLGRETGVLSAHTSRPSQLCRTDPRDGGKSSRGGLSPWGDFTPTQTGSRERGATHQLPASPQHQHPPSQQPEWGKVLVPARAETSPKPGGASAGASSAAATSVVGTKYGSKVAGISHGLSCVCAAGASVPSFGGKPRGEVSSLRASCSEADQSHTQKIGVRAERAGGNGRCRGSGAGSAPRSRTLPAAS